MIGWLEHVAHPGHQDERRAGVRCGECLPLIDGHLEICRPLDDGDPRSNFADFDPWVESKPGHEVRLDRRAVQRGERRRDVRVDPAREDRLENPGVRSLGLGRRRELRSQLQPENVHGWIAGALEGNEGLDLNGV